MASKSKIKGIKTLAVQFAAVTGASEEIGCKLLDICNGNLEMAIGMQLEGGIEGAQSRATSSGDAEASDSAGPSFASSIENEDNVRPPIPQKQEVLVPHVPSFGPRPKRRGGKSSVFDKFRDFQAETRQQEEMIRRGENNRGLAAKKRTLEDLFRPPLDIMHKGTLNTAREYGQSQCKWVIVNVQNVQEFSCQQLNRDVWSDSTVKSIINESFVFWQVYHDSDEGQRYMQFYKVNEFPYVAVLDPRTGEQMASWTRLDNMSFCDLAIQFLTDHPMFDKDGISPPKKRLKTQKSIIDASEDSQLEAAIAASLAESSASNSQPDNKEPAIPTSSSTIPSAIVRRKIISIPDDDDDDDNDSDTFHSVNDSSSDEDSDNVDVVTVVKSKVNSVKTEQKTEKTSSSDSGTANHKKANKDEETGEKHCEKRTSKESNIDTKVESSKEKEPLVKDESSKGKEPVVEEPEAAQSASTSRHNGASEHDTGSDDTDEDNAASEADAIDPSNACNLMLRFPDGKRKQVTLQATDSLLKLVKLVSKDGFSNERYELVTNFPRRRLSFLDINTNLKAAGLFPQETIFIQER